MRGFACAALFVLLCARAAHAGPWTIGRWHFFAQLRMSGMFADRRYDAAGDLQPIQAVLPNGTIANTSYREFLTDLFVELGLAARLSLLVDFRALDVIVQPLGGGNRGAVGVSDLWLAAKLLLFDDEFSAAILVGLTAPTGSATTVAPLGPGDLRTDFMLLLGKLWARPSLFLSGELGVRLRGSAQAVDPHKPGGLVDVPYSHELRYAAEAGYSWVARRRGLYSLVAALKLEGAWSFSRYVEDGLGLLNPQASMYVKLGPELVYTPRPGVHLSLGGHYFVAGRAIPAMGELALGVAYSR